jgi:hypothetical protein
MLESHAGVDSTFTGARFICATLVVMQGLVDGLKYSKEPSALCL